MPKVVAIQGFQPKLRLQSSFYGTKAYNHWYERALGILGLNPTYSGFHSYEVQASSSNLLISMASQIELYLKLLGIQTALVQSL